MRLLQLFDLNLYLFKLQNILLSYLWKDSERTLERGGQVPTLDYI